MSEITAWIDYIIRGASTIRDFCESRYGEAPSLYRGIDLQNPPSDINAPLIAIEAMRHEGGSEQDSESYYYTVSVGVVQEDFGEVSETSDQLGGVTLGGVDEVQDFLYLIRNLLDEQLPEEIFISECTVELQEVIQAPMYQGALVFTVKCYRCLGGIVSITPPPP
jgi:hypothetical protein